MTLQEIDAMKWMIDALDHLTQYALYSDVMSKEGKGFVPCNKFTPAYLRAGLKAAIQNTIIGKTDLTQREQTILDKS